MYVYMLLHSLRLDLKVLAAGGRHRLPAQEEHHPPGLKARERPNLRQAPGEQAHDVQREDQRLRPVGSSVDR